MAISEKKDLNQQPDLPLKKPEKEQKTTQTKQEKETKEKPNSQEGPIWIERGKHTWKAKAYDR